MSKNVPYWFIREDDKLIQCSKTDFDQAIRDGKSVKYRTYADKRTERVAETLEASRMKLLNNPQIPTKFRQILTDPIKVIQVQIIDADDPEFWNKELKLSKYQTVLNEK
jgi:hypothetical protein